MIILYKITIYDNKPNKTLNIFGINFTKNVAKVTDIYKKKAYNYSVKGWSPLHKIQDQRRQRWKHMKTIKIVLL